MEVLSAFIREHSREKWPPGLKEGEEGWTRADVQAALTVVGRRDIKRDIRRIDLYNVHLIATDLNGADLSGTILNRAYLERTGLRKANLSGVPLNRQPFKARTLTARNSAARTSQTRPLLTGTSPMRTSRTLGGPAARQFRRAGD